MNKKYYLAIIIIIIFILIILININIINLKILQAFRKIIQKYPLYPIINIYDNSNPSINDLYSLLHPYHHLPKLNNYDIIPNNLFQIYMFYKNPVPQYVFDAINKYANNYNYYLFNDKDATKFLSYYFNNKIVRRFNDLRLGAHKADLLRYCLLYVYGGIYIDIKTILTMPLDEIFIDKKLFYTCIADFHTVIYNGLIASKSRNILFLKLIMYIVDMPLYIANEPTSLLYLKFCKDLYVKIQSDTVNKKIHPGLNIGFTQNYYLFQEESTFELNDQCTKFDRYGGCNVIKDGNKKIFDGRDPKFPW